MSGVREPVVTVPPEAAGLVGGGPHRALFLDRDGVVNVDHGYVHTPGRTEWVPGIFELARAARAAGYVLVVATNQAGIARGYYDEEQFRAYTRWVHARFAEEGAPLLATYYCPHHPEAGQGAYKVACACRKPEPGMLLEAIGRHGLDPAGSVMVGDTPKDMEAAAAAGSSAGSCCAAPGRSRASVRRGSRSPAWTRLPGRWWPAPGRPLRRPAVTVRARRWRESLKCMGNARIIGARCGRSSPGTGPADRATQSGLPSMDPPTVPVE
ncbi:D-glycero-beta-D-manno-heptose 1,7-bisphosphate 7-phosphatase [Pseudoxanthomonas suwonensis]